MRLADFIEQRIALILDEWVEFARSLVPAANGLDTEALKDHAGQMLHAVALDLRMGQTPQQEEAKSKGLLADVKRKVPETAAELHAILRAKGGFSIDQLVSEYRALRASVLRIYSAEHAFAAEALTDIGRFNEAIDQAIAESVKFYSAEVERWRNVFLGVLGHDLRGPLNAIVLTSKFLAQLRHEESVSDAAARLIRNGERMRELLDDLLDYNRTSLGLGIPINPSIADLETICREEIELRQASHPGAQIRFSSDGRVEGPWDASRLRQLLGNLITNAVQHGEQAAAIDVRLASSDRQVEVSVSNQGRPISSERLASLFDPLRSAQVAGRENPQHLGLGLFIVREIARAHRGTVDVVSRDGVTTFSVCLPRTDAGHGP